MPLNGTFQVRATRARPPGRAADPERSETYGAALAQFDELMTAAAGSSPASRPLPLFYALSQAGRAIAAAGAESPWRLRQHGLSAPKLAVPVLDVKVRRSKATAAGTVDSFSGVAAATRATGFEKAATIGELWASLPEIFELLPSQPERSPMLLVPDSPYGELVPWGQVRCTVIGSRVPPEQLVEHMESSFPTSPGVRLHQPQSIPHIFQHTDHGSGVSVWWPADTPDVAGHLRVLRSIQPEGNRFDPFWLQPAVGGAAQSSLLTWWALLFGLSMLARYEPAGWIAALDYDSSELAAPLEGLLDIGLSRVPGLVLSALTATSELPAAG